MAYGRRFQVPELSARHPVAISPASGRYRTRTDDLLVVSRKVRTQCLPAFMVVVEERQRQTYLLSMNSFRSSKAPVKNVGLNNW